MNCPLLAAVALPPGRKLCTYAGAEIFVSYGAEYWKDVHSISHSTAVIPEWEWDLSDFALSSPAPDGPPAPINGGANPPRPGAGGPGTGYPAKLGGSWVFWSLQPVKHPATPKVKNPTWVKNPIDAFILSRLEAKGLTPAPPADKRTLLRRVSYDLIGLPPTPEEMAGFLGILDQTSVKHLGRIYVIIVHANTK